ncbi:MAG TPA: hypothetical protein VN630_09120, partial [Rhodanobacteraceae bacterium]|nr:hypothetical protein [Rhodanobacteraceae bacterium]
ETRDLRGRMTLSQGVALSSAAYAQIVAASCKECRETVFPILHVECNSAKPKEGNPHRSTPQAGAVVMTASAR